MAQQAGSVGVISHRSGETDAASISDLVVALNTGQIKTRLPVVNAPPSTIASSALRNSATPQPIPASPPLTMSGDEQELNVGR